MACLRGRVDVLTRPKLAENHAMLQTERSASSATHRLPLRTKPCARFGAAGNRPWANAPRPVILGREGLAPVFRKLSPVEI
jgi:hypothetical protein